MAFRGASLLKIYVSSTLLRSFISRMLTQPHESDVLTGEDIRQFFDTIIGNVKPVVNEVPSSL
jgi:hypothetical protein